jgi:hypothetical protein
MNDDEFSIKSRTFANEHKKFYVYNHTTNTSTSKDYESKADAYKAMSDIIYPIIKQPIISKKTCNLFSV